MPAFAAISRRLRRRAVNGVPAVRGNRFAALGPTMGVPETPIAGTDVGRGTGTAYPVQEADPVREYASGGLGASLPDAKTVLSRTTDDVSAEFGGDRLWDLMDNDPTVSSAIWSLVYGAITTTLRITPALTSSPDPDQERPPEVVEAEEAAELCVQLTAGMECPPEAILAEMAIDTLKYGCMLSEMVWEVIDAGPNSGLLRVKSINVKPRSVWQFVVDAFSSVAGFLVVSPGGSGFSILPPEKFLVLAWGRRGGDPRGRTILRAAFNAWNIKVQLWPEFFRFLSRFASPGLVGESAPGETGRPGYQSDGVPVPTASVPLPVGPPIPVAGQADVSPERDFLREILKFQVGKAIVVPPGGKLTALETSGDGSAFIKAIDLLKREITQAILLAVRATMESEHGSKADSETAQDLMGLVTGALRRLVCTEYRRQVLYRVLLFNKGKEYADRNLPNVDLGDAESQDKAAMWNAYANVEKSSVPLTRSQRIKMQVGVGIPAPEPGEEYEAKPGTPDTSQQGPPDDTQDEPADEPPDDEKAAA